MTICDLADRWLGGKLTEMGRNSIDQLDLAKCKAPLKDSIAGSLHGALVYMDRQIALIRDMERTTRELRDQLIESQDSVVKLQEQLIESKNEQLVRARFLFSFLFPFPFLFKNENRNRNRNRYILISISISIFISIFIYI